MARELKPIIEVMSEDDIIDAVRDAILNDKRAAYSAFQAELTKCGRWDLYEAGLADARRVRLSIPIEWV